MAAAGIGTISSLEPSWSRDLYRLMKQGGMTERQADKRACRLGLHPGDIWSELYWPPDDLVDLDAGGSDAVDRPGSRRQEVR